MIAGPPAPPADARRRDGLGGRRQHRLGRLGRRAAGGPALGGRAARARPPTGSAASSPRSPTPTSCSGRLPARRAARRAASASTRRPPRRRRGRPGATSSAWACEECAEGIITVAVQEMVRALRLVSVERGEDPREATLIAFGGAGPLHACPVADELGVRARGGAARRRRARGARAGDGRRAARLRPDGAGAGRRPARAGRRLLRPLRARAEREIPGAALSARPPTAATPARATP